MLTAVQTESAAAVTETVTQNLEGSLSSTALLLFRALHEVAVEASAERDYHPKTSQVSFFCPVESVALALGVHRATVYRALPELLEAGLVDYRGHYCTHQGRTRSDGTVWAVRLRSVGGCKARLGYGDLKKQYRSLGSDIEAGRTAWALMRQSKLQPKRSGVNLGYIRQWALSSTDKTPVTSDCRITPRRDLESIFDLPHVPREARPTAVDMAAEALAAALRDRGSTNFYRRLLWQLLRRSDATGADYSHMVYQMARRASTDAQEGFARRPGALFVSRLKDAPWFDAVMRQPPTRVASVPA